MGKVEVLRGSRCRHQGLELACHRFRFCGATRVRARYRSAWLARLHRLSKFRKWLLNQEVMDDLLNQTAQRAELVFERLIDEQIEKMFSGISGQ